MPRERKEPSGKQVKLKGKEVLKINQQYMAQFLAHTAADILLVILEDINGCNIVLDRMGSWVSLNHMPIFLFVFYSQIVRIVISDYHNKPCVITVFHPFVSAFTVSVLTVRLCGWTGLLARSNLFSHSMH